MADPLNPNPEIEDAYGPDDPGDWITMRRRAAQTAAMQGLEESPQDGARALELSKSTGVPAPVIHGDLEGFEEGHKARLTSSLLSDNEFLRNYALSNPMAPVVSGSDWGALAEHSDALERFHARMQKGLFNAPMRGFAEGFGNEPAGSFFHPRESDVEFERQYPNLYAFGKQAIIGVGEPFELGSRIFSGVAGAVKETAKSFYQAVGGDETQAEKFANSIAGMAEYEATKGEGVSDIAKYAEAWHAAKPWLQARKEPPRGIHPEIDKAITEDSKEGMKSLDEVMKTRDATQTFDLAPDTAYKDFASQFGEGYFGISAEAVRQLYKDKVPEAEDGLLGWIPDLQKQLESAGAYDDIEVPRSEFLSKMDPDLYKEIHDFIRVRPGAMTLDETKGPKPTAYEEEFGKPPEEAPTAKPEEEPHPPQVPDPVETIRKAAGLEPDPIRDLMGEPETQTLKLPPGAGPDVIEGTHATGESLHSMKVGDILPQLNFDSLPTEQRSLSEFWQRYLSTEAKNIPLHFVEQAEFNRIFPRNTTAGGLHWQGEVFIPDSMLEAHPQSLNTILLHEAAHAITVNSLEKFPAIKKVVRDMMDELGSKFEKLPEDIDYAWVNEREFIAEGVAHGPFRKVLQETEMSPELAQRLGLPGDRGTFWDAVKKIFADLWEQIIGKAPEPSMMEGFFRVMESLEEANKLLEDMNAAEGFTPSEAPKRPEGPVKSAGREGLSSDMIRQYLEKIEKQGLEDQEHREKIAQKRAAEQVTKEWKDREKEIRPEVRRDVESRPDIIADKLLLDGTYQGKKVGKPRLAEEMLTDEQKAALPPNTYGKDGIDPAAIAGLVGYTSPEQLVSRMAELYRQRQDEGLTRAAQVTKAVDIELERRMQAEGKLEEKILQEAQDYLPSQTQIDILSDQAFLLAQLTGQKLPLDLKAMAKKAFGGLKVGQANAEALLRSSHLAGQAVQEALLKDLPGDAFKAKLDQTLTMMKLAEANKLAKDRGVWDRNAKNFQKRLPPGVDPEYVNFIHDILVRAGEGVRGRTVQDIAKEIEAGPWKTLEDFTDHKASMLREMPVADFLLNPDWKGKVDDLTVDQFRALNDSVKTLIHNGRDEKKAISAGNAADLDTVKQEMMEQLGTYEIQKDSLNHGPISKVLRAIRTYGAAHLQLESIMNRIDQGDPFGRFSKYIIHDMATSATDEANLTRGTAELLRNNKYQGNIEERIPNNLWRDPVTGILFDDFRRKNLLGAMLYTGTEVRLRKLAMGYKLEPEQVMQWIHSVATKEDWDFVQGMWKTYRDLKDKADVMERNQSGLPAQEEDPLTIQTPFGDIEGGYAKLIYDKRWTTGSQKLLGGDPLELHGYEKATTPRGYTKQVTGFVGPIQLNLEAHPGAMTQMIHDIAFREAVVNVSKFFYDKKFQDGFRKHFGTVYGDLLVPWLKDVANYTNTPMDSAKAAYQYYGNQVRQNMVQVLVGMNPNTVLKHGLTALAQSVKDAGGPTFVKYFTKMFQGNDEIAESNWQFARTKFDEIARRERNFMDTLGGAQEIAQVGMPWKAMLQKAGSYMVTKSDLASSVPLALAEYEKAKVAGETEGDAIYLANRAVRRTHGSSVITNLSRIQRTRDPVLGSFVSLMGFYNHMTNRLYEVGWKSHDTYLGIKEGSEDRFQHIPDIASGLVYYAVLPALIGGVVTGVRKDQSWASWAAESLAHELAGSWTGLRDIADAALHGKDFSAGMVGASAKTITDLAKDIGRGRQAFNREHAGRTALHVFELGGMLSGLTNAQEGRMAEFMIDWYNGKERPKTWADIGKGLWHGTLEKRR